MKITLGDSLFYNENVIMPNNEVNQTLIKFFNKE